MIVNDKERKEYCHPKISVIRESAEICNFLTGLLLSLNSRREFLAEICTNQAFVLGYNLTKRAFASISL